MRQVDNRTSIDDSKNGADTENYTGGLSLSDIKNIIEAVLFAAGYAVTYKKLGAVTGMNAEQIKTIAEQLEGDYKDRGIKLLLFADSMQLTTDEKYTDQIKQALGITHTSTLSNSSLEVLAIVAYNQPVTKAYIEQIRGVDSSYAVSVLCERGIIESKGKLEVPGKPNLYGTTDEFLRLFGISSLKELPPIDVIRGT